MVAERLIASDPIAYAAKWDSLKTFIDIALYILKSFSSESIASSSQSKTHMEKKLTLIAAKQEEMDVKLQTIVARHDEMGSNLRTILELLRQKP